MKYIVIDCLKSFVVCKKHKKCAIVRGKDYTNEQEIMAADNHYKDNQNSEMHYSSVLDTTNFRLVNGPSLN